MDVGGVGSAGEIDATQAERATEEVGVAIGEAGKNEFAARVNHASTDAAHLGDGFLGTDGNDLAAADGNGLGPRLSGIEGIDASVNDEDVGGSDTRGVLRRRGVRDGER